MAHNRTTIQLYRDCLRLARYIGREHNSADRAPVVSQNLVRTVRSQFRSNMHETDPERIREQREVAISGLTQYMFFFARTSALRDQSRRKAGAPDRNIFTEPDEEEELPEPSPATPAWTEKSKKNPRRREDGVGLGLEQD